MDKVLAITGATGKSGGSFLSVLMRNNKQIMNCFGGVRLLVRSASKVSEISHAEIKTEVICGNLSDNNYLKSALTGVDTVFHIAGIHFSMALVDAAIYCGVRRLILVHTTGIYSKFKKAGEGYRKIDEYCEQQCSENNISLTILRPTMIYGNTRDNNVIQFIKMVDRFPIMPVVNGALYALQPVHYEDLGMAYYQVLTNEKSTVNKNFNLSGGHPILLRNMLIEIGKNLGKTVHFFNCPFFVAYTGAWAIYCLTFGKKDYREKVQRLCEERVYSHEAAKDCFGYSPRSFEEGIVGEVSEYLQNKNP